MAIRQGTVGESYRCPECDSVLSFAHDTWGCGDCHYVPNQGAD